VPPEPVAHPSFREAVRFWARLGLINFGGPTGQIAIMHRELVERKRWISEQRFLHALNYCMLLPGPEATQLAIYVGWLLHRGLGGLLAGVLFVLPAVFVLLGLSAVYVTWGTVPLIAGFFLGLKATVLAVVVFAVRRIARRALRTTAMVAVAGLAFLALLAGAPFPLVIALAALAGALGRRYAPGQFRAAPAHAGAGEGRAVLGDEDATPDHALPSRARFARVLAVGGALWAAALLLLAAFPGEQHVFLDDGLFFSQAALVTFGGAYAVLSYITQVSVQVYHWLTPAQMLDGLGLAETTPGPLIMVVQWVGFLAGFHFPGALPPLWAGVLGGLVATYVTFLPSFLFIFLGAPYVEALRGREDLQVILTCITAAVVGVILHLALFFGSNVLVVDGRPQVFVLAVAAGAFLALLSEKVDIIPVILAGGSLGLAARLGGIA
jgi:chromate transporter